MTKIKNIKLLNIIENVSKAGSEMHSLIKNNKSLKSTDKEEIYSFLSDMHLIMGTLGIGCATLSNIYFRSPKEVSLKVVSGNKTNE